METQRRAKENTNDAEKNSGTTVRSARGHRSSVGQSPPIRFTYSVRPIFSPSATATAAITSTPPPPLLLVLLLSLPPPLKQQSSLLPLPPPPSRDNKNWSGTHKYETRARKYKHTHTRARAYTQTHTLTHPKTQSLPPCLWHTHNPNPLLEQTLYNKSV